MQGSIFISYSRNDLDAVKPIKEELERNGFSCWMDIDGIESGDENFKQKIVPAIDGCRAVLFFISVASQESEWTAKELGYAKRHGKRVVPLRFNDDPLVGVFDFDYGDADIIDWRRPEQKEKLLEDLRRWSDETNKTSETSSPTTTRRLLKSKSAPKRRKQSPKKKFPISMDFVYSDTRDYLNIGWGVRFYCLKVKNHNRGPVSVTISVRNGRSRAIYRDTIEGNSTEKYRTLGLSCWRFKHGDHGTIKVLGWSKCLKFRLDEDGVMIS